MNRLDALLERLPPLYTVDEGSLLYRIMALFSTYLTAFDEDMDRVQRSHWIDTAIDRDDLVKIGAQFGIKTAPWEPDELYRSRIKATVAARFAGAVTRDNLEKLLVALCDGAFKSFGVKYFDMKGSGRIFRDPPASGQTDPLFIEFPPVNRRCEALVQKRGLVKPLEKIAMVNQSLYRTPLEVIIRGIEGWKTLSPVLVNLTNGTALVYPGDLPCGRDLYLQVNERGTITASIDEVDVTGDMRSFRDYHEIGVHSIIDHTKPVEPVMLERGGNTLWFFPLALYNHKSLSSAVFGMPSPEVSHGVFSSRNGKVAQGTAFGSSLFEQGPMAVIDAWWTERLPASFRFEVPLGIIPHPPLGSHCEFVEKQQLLLDLMNETVRTLRAAGVDGRVCGRPFRSTQYQNDRVRVWSGETGTVQQFMESRLRGVSGAFDTGNCATSYFS